MSTPVALSINIICIKRLKFQRDQLSTIDDILAQIYADRNGKSVEDVKAKMKVAAWIKAADAVEFGIVDEVIDAVKVDSATPQNVKNIIINDMGLPPLPSGFNPESGEETPAGVIQKAMDLLKGLKNSFANNQDSKMIKIFASTMALLAIKDGFQPNEQGDIVLTQDQMKKIDDQLKSQDDACKAAKTTIDKMKAEIDKLKSSIASKDEEIKNLKEGPGESGNGGEVVDEQGLNGAAELFKSIENAL